MTALYLERTMNFGLTLEELQSGRPMIGIAQSGSDIPTCNRHHLVLAQRMREGIRDAVGVAFEFPLHPIQETCKRPTAMLDRNLQYLSLVEALYGYGPDNVSSGCDRDRQHTLHSSRPGPGPGVAGNRFLGRLYRHHFEGLIGRCGSVSIIREPDLDGGELTCTTCLLAVASHPRIATPALAARHGGHIGNVEQLQRRYGRCQDAPGSP
jgi:dihydroxy-acid dehydratase